MIFAKKSLGQNFLKSEKALAQIVEAADINASDIILEIGPGEGALTKKIIAKKPSTLILVEKDDRLIPILEETFEIGAKNKKVKILHGDIIDLLKEKDIESLAKAGIKSGYKIIGNIPYYITGLIIRNIFELAILPEKVILLVQKEVAERIVAQDKKESLLSLSIKLYGTPKKVAVVPRGAFVPAPNVDSAIICIDNIVRKINAKQERQYFETIKAAFAHKRKLLSSNLTAVSTTEKIQEAFKELALDKNTRAEDLPVDTFIRLSEYLV